jgi:hypothetical protein
MKCWWRREHCEIVGASKQMFVVKRQDFFDQTRIAGYVSQASITQPDEP